MPQTKPIHVGILIFPGFPMACLTSMIEPLRAANEIADEIAFEWSVIAEQGGRVESSAKVSFESDMLLADAQGLDMVFLLSGPLGEFDTPGPSNGALRMMERHGAILGGVSGGVFPLVRSGLMQGYACSVHWCYEAAFRTEFPQIEAADAVIVLDRRRYTAAGAAAAFDLALHLIEDRLGGDVATEVACWFQHPLVRSMGERQRIPTFRRSITDDMLPGPVGRAVALFANRIEETISVAEVADEVGVSARQLERTFKKATGQSPSHYYRSLRMKAARQLVIYSRDTMTQIALAVGYASASPMVQHYKATFGRTPQQDRAEINRFRVTANSVVPSI